MDIAIWLVRTLHILAGAVWVGGSLIYLLVVIPALRATSAAPATAAQIAALFKQLVNVCIGILLLSGGYLTLARLALPWLGLPYVVTLGVKAGAAIALFLLAFYMGQSRMRRLAKQRSRLAASAPYLQLALGILIFILGALLNALFEAALASRY